jgi:hypothetical protein
LSGKVERLESWYVKKHSLINALPTCEPVNFPTYQLSNLSTYICAT